MAPHLKRSTRFFCLAASLAIVTGACSRDTTTAPLAVPSFRAANAFPDFGAVTVCNYFSVPGVSGAGIYQVNVNGADVGAPVSLADDGQCAVVWQTPGDGTFTIKVTQISTNCTQHLAVRQLLTDGNFQLVFNESGPTNTWTASVTTANGLSATGLSLWFQNGSGGCNPPPPPPNACPDRPAVFGLGSAGAFTVLGLTGADVIISEGDTYITGDVGLGPNDTGDLLKATITGTLYLNGPANPAIPDIHPDLTVTGGIVTADLSGAVASASAASNTLRGLAPEQTFGDITKATTFTGTGGTTHVINLSSVKIIKTTLTFVGGPNDVFVMNVAGDFTFGSAQMILRTTAAGTVRPENIIWNIYSSGADVNVYKDITTWYGLLLVPRRNVIIDHTVGTGGVFGGLKIAIHSAATVKCK